MDKQNYKWHFPSTGGGEEDGINNPLMQYFEGDHEKYIARETIQNSLDARRNDENPVKVIFERATLPITELLGLEQLRDIFNKAKNYCPEDRIESRQFYNNALKLIAVQNISVLKISDYNTCGLCGSDDDSTGDFYKLIRSKGINDMRNDGGGSFGIGKGAPFVASGLRTVFYSTINDENEYVFCGKARLSSYRDDSGDIRQGTGQFGFKNHKIIRSIRTSDGIPNFFHRTERGTDLYIIGYPLSDKSWIGLLIRSLLNSFWASIHFGDLQVELRDGQEEHTITTKNLGEYMERFANDKGDSYCFYQSIINYTYKLNNKLESLGEVELFLRIGQNLPKRIQMMRRPKMVVSEKRFRFPEQYAGVFICKSPEGNKLLRGLEPPKHDKWDPELDKANGRKIHMEFIRWIRKSLSELSENSSSQSEDIPGLSDYLNLPLSEDLDELTSASGSQENLEDDHNGNETGHEIGKTDRPLEVTPERIPPQKISPIIQPSIKGTKISKPVVENTQNSRKNSRKQGFRSGKEGLLRINPANVLFRAHAVDIEGERMHQAVISADSNEEGSIRLVAIGDDKNYPIEISSVTDQFGNSLQTDKETIKNIVLTPNQPLKLLIKFNNNNRYALGLE